MIDDILKFLILPLETRDVSLYVILFCDENDKRKEKTSSSSYSTESLNIKWAIQMKSMQIFAPELDVCRVRFGERIIGLFLVIPLPIGPFYVVHTFTHTYTVHVPISLQ
jgi:hypothetical protein